MGRFIVILVTLLVSPAVLFSQAARQWESMDAVGKLVYVTGFAQGYIGAVEFSTQLVVPQVNDLRQLSAGPKVGDVDKKLQIALRYFDLIPDHSPEGVIIWGGKATPRIEQKIRENPSYDLPAILLMIAYEIRREEDTETGK